MSEIVPINSLQSLTEENAELRLKLARIETENADLERQVGEMFILQQIFSTINSTLELDDVLGTVLRGVREAMSFDRVVLFEVSESGVSRHLETDKDGNIVTGFASPRARQTDAFMDMINMREEILAGTALDDQSPVEGDVGGGWCMASLLFREKIRGILYVDRPRLAEIGESQMRMLLDFAAQAAIAIENSRLHRETRRLLDDANRLAMTDPLTGLSNRRALEETIDREIANASRRNATLAIMLLDLDDLKKINDSLGHKGGDEALCSLANVLRACARRGDMAGRWGGDEFMLLLAEADYVQASFAADRIYEAFAAAGVKGSSGLAVYPNHGRTVTELVNAADRGLYGAKRDGKNRWSYGGPAPVPDSFKMLSSKD